MSRAEIEKRLAAIEREVAHLKQGHVAAAITHPVQVLEQIHGTFEDDAAFREAMRLGRRWRKGLRAKNPKAKAKRR